MTPNHAGSPLQLTREELVRLTGRRRARAQAAWIRRHFAGCPVHLNAANECIVIRAHIESVREPMAHDRPPIRQVRLKVSGCHFLSPSTK